MGNNNVLELLRERAGGTQRSTGGNDVAARLRERAKGASYNPQLPSVENTNAALAEARQRQEQEEAKRQREAQATQTKLPLYGAVGGLYNKYGLSTGSQIVSGNAKRLEQREMQKQLDHATEMSDVYSQLYGSGETTPGQKAEALEQKNRFDREAWAAQQRLDELGYVEPNSVFVPDYAALPMKPGFDIYAKMGEGMETELRPEEMEGSYTYFDLLSDEEQGVFNYLLATQGEESARNYMDFMKNTAQHRYGQRVAQGIEDSDWRTGALIANSIGTGVTNWMEGMLGAYGAATGQEVAENGLNYASPYIKENLGTVGNVAYDLGVTVGNMLPSVMLGGAAGNVSMGLSAGGNAYQQGIREGMSNSEALVYGSLIGASEAYLQRAIGGISRLGGAKASKLDDALRGIENGFLRFISKTGVGMMKEGGEEALQAALEPMFNSLITGSDVNIDWSEVAYNALMGALMGGVFEAPQNLVETVLTEGKDAMFAPASEKPQNFASKGVMPTDNNVPAEAGNAAEIRPDSPGLAQARGQLRQSTFAAAEKSFGKEGYAAFQTQAQAMDNPADSFGEMTRAYNDGFVNRHAASYGSLSSAQYEAMFEAGRADAAASVKSQMDKRGKVFSYKDAGIDMADAATKEYAASLDAKDSKSLNAAAKAFGLKIRFADSVAGGDANAEIRNGIITIEKGNPNPLRFLFGHEVTHRMQELAPQEYARLREAVAERAADFRVDVADTIANYRKHGKSIDPNYAVDEVVADEIGKILEKDENLERFIARFSGERTLLQKLRDIIHDIRVVLVGTDAEKQLLRVEKRLTEAAKVAAKQAQSNAGAAKNAAQTSDGEFKTMFKLKDKDESNSIKSQIGASLARLNAMEPVANFTVPTSFGKTMGDARKWVINTLKASGYRVERKDFGTIVFNEKRLNTSLDYINNPAEIGAYAALPRVLKRGIKIGEHNNHKGRDYGTVTFAAPVVMNGKRGNMGVVVKMTSQNYYKMHRILMPDGSVYELNVQKNAESTPAKGAASIGSHASPIDSAVTTKVTQEVDIVKIEDAGIAIDESGEAALPGRMSLKTWNQSNYVKTRDTAAAELAKALGVSEAEAKAYIDDINSIAKTVAEDKGRLDFEAADNQVMLKDNQEYVKTLDASTLCAKRLVYQGTFDAIQHRLPNTMLSSDDLIGLLNMMREHGVETPCGVCYVESRRRHLGKFAQEWLNGYRGEYIPKLDEVTTSDGLEALRHSHPKTYEDFMSAMSKKGSANPKVVQLRTEYRNEIMSLTRAQIRKIEAIGGLRVQSFSDFETPHLLDMMQAVMDMSAKNLHSQAYTKVPNFAWVFGNTGIKINLSLIAEGDGFDAEGNLAFSSVEGMDFDEAMKLRDAYSDNVGTIIVGANDKHILACMADDRIDFIIPFHRSGWGKKELAMMGMDTYEDYTYGQNEHDLSSGKNVKNFYPHDYWDYSLSGKENAERYLNLCASTGREPKFSKFLVNNGDGSYSLQPDGSTDGYWKTLIDFKMYNNEGEGAPQQTVRPNFNMKEARRVLDEYEGGANSLPVANDVVEEFVSKYRAEHPQVEYSLKGGGELSEKVRRIREEGAAAGRSEADIQAEVRSVVDKVYQQMLTDFGAIEPGENAYREVQVPSRTAKTNKVSQTARTVMEAQATPDDFIPLLKENVAKGGFSFMPISNDETLLDAEGWILARGWQTALKDWTAEVRRGMGGARVTAVGALLYNHAVNAGDYNTAMDILADYQLTVRNDARGLQAARILKTLTPENRLYMIQKSIQSMVDDLGLKSKDGEKLELPAELIETYKKAKTNKEIDEAVGNIQQYVADNVKFSLGDRLRDKWTALRYVNMLGNLKTQVRNISGNVGMKVVGSVENAVATFLEAAAGKKATKTRALVVSPEMRRLASADFENIRHDALGEDKYTIGNENRSAFEAGVLERRRVFWFPPLEAYRKATNWAMNNKYFGDEAFSRSGYARALAGYLTANKISVEQFASTEWQEKHRDFVDKARMFAIKRAQELTFRDHNTFSDWVSKVGRRPDTPAAVRKVSEGVLPFRRTPANVLLRAEEYSPLGIINTAIAAARAAKGKDNVTGTDVINSLSKTLTGTGIFIMGMVLQNLGLLKGSDDEDQRVAQFEELVGHQTYALELKDGTSITLDWLTPSSMPLFMGAQLEALRQDGGFELKDIEAAMLSIADPMLQMSMMQGLNDSLSDLRYAQDANIGQLIASAALGYLTQGLTNSLVGQSERAHNTESTMTYTQDTALPTWLQKEIGAVSRKTPGWDFQQIPYIDAWGRIEDLGSTWERATNSFLNPAYLSKVDISSMEVELMRLYEKLGEDASAVFPSRAQKYIDNVPINPIDPESETMRKDLTAEEYVKYATEKGQRSYNLLTNMMGSEVYKRLDEIDQVDAIDKAYDYANAIAKTSVSDYKLDGWVAKANKAITETKIKPEVYIPIYVAQGNIESLKNKEGKSIPNSKSLQVMQLVYSVPGLTDKQRKALFEAFDVSEGIRHYNRTLVEQKLREMQRKAR